MVAFLWMYFCRSARLLLNAENELILLVADKSVVKQFELKHRSKSKKRMYTFSKNW